MRVGLVVLRAVSVARQLLAIVHGVVIVFSIPLVMVHFFTPAVARVGQLEAASH